MENSEAEREWGLQFIARPRVKKSADRENAENRHQRITQKVPSARIRHGVCQLKIEGFCSSEQNRGGKPDSKKVGESAN